MIFAVVEEIVLLVFESMIVLETFDRIQHWLVELAVLRLFPLALSVRLDRVGSFFQYFENADELQQCYSVVLALLVNDASDFAQHEYESVDWAQVKSHFRYQMNTRKKKKKEED